MDREWDKQPSTCRKHAQSFIVTISHGFFLFFKTKLKPISWENKHTSWFHLVCNTCNRLYFTDALGSISISISISFYKMWYLHQPTWEKADRWWRWVSYEQEKQTAVINLTRSIPFRWLLREKSQSPIWAWRKWITCNHHLRQLGSDFWVQHEREFLCWETPWPETSNFKITI